MLIDGYGFVFRAYHSLPPLTNAQGQPIGAVYGFVNMLYKFISAHSADYIAVVLDSGQKNFRHEIYPNYKANRPPAPEDLVPQFPIVREAVEAFGINAIDALGYEADDLIATYARLAREQGIEVVIVSSDKDLMQLIGDGVSMYDAMKDRVIKEAEVLAKFGVTPSGVLDVLALMGDSSDNIPGVRGIGPKTAAELINQFHSIENLYANIDALPKSKRKEMLLSSKEDALISKRLASLDENSPTTTPIEALRAKDLELPKLREFLQKHGFKALLHKLGDQSSNSVSATQDIAATTAVRKTVVTALPDNISKLMSGDAIGITITPEQIEISGDVIYRIPLQARQGDLFDNQQSSEEGVIRSIAAILEDSSIKKYGFNYKRLRQTLLEYGVNLNNYHDLAVMAYSLDTANNDLKEIEIIRLAIADAQEVDSELILRAGRYFHQSLREQKLLSIYDKIDRPIQELIIIMERNGVLINQSVLKDLSRYFQDKISSYEAKVFEQAGEEFNIGSPKQLANILFNKLAIKSKQKGNSTGVEILEEIAHQGYQIARDILDWRHFSKLKNTYTDPLPKLINMKTGRIHTTFSTTSTTTGRLSSQHPNLQNIPIRTEEGHKIRSAFVARPGHMLVSADYSQIELRLLAEIGDVKPLKRAFMEGRDIHTATAMEIFGLPAEAVDSDTRRKAKTINFGIIYGISAFGLAERLGMPRGEAQAFIDLYFQRYPEIKVYMEQTIQDARASGYIKTATGRRCSIKYINDKNYGLRSFAERAAINAPLQGTASDIIKLAMINLPPMLREALILQVHDELIFEVPQENAQESALMIKKVMESAYRLSIPLTVDVGIASSWDKL